MNSIYAKYIAARQKKFASYISDNVIDGDVPDKDGKLSVFLAANGGWQTKYLSLYEMLHDKYIAKYCAKLLLDEYLNKNYSLISRILNSGIEKSEKHKLLYDEIAFTKIIAVTISSQLIGVALWNLIRDDDKYFFLRYPNEVNRLKSCPILLRLSSYYSFDEEKPFREIREQDKVVIVNDVISTGNLVYKIFKNIQNKGAVINAVFSIADTRIPESCLLPTINFVNANDQNDMIESEYLFGNVDEENTFFSLFKFYGDGNEFRKYRRPYKGTAEIKRINPLLNTIVELETRHSEEKRVLFPNPGELLKNEIIEECYFKIGHFRQNLSHHGYLVDMHNIFSTDGANSQGEKLLMVLKKKLDSFLSEYQSSNDIINTIINNISLLKKEGFSSQNLDNVESEFLTHISTNDSLLSTKTSYKPDYIFYPPFSGIEQLSENLLHKCFGTPIENIICTQRFDTSKGWRFPFPAKWYNHLTKDKSILILDSGSLTGESLVQLVDTVAFLDVRKITVLSAITRVEDFYREFYSRIKFIKVKTLQTNDSLNTDDGSRTPEHIVPLNIIFGTSLNIPVFPSKMSCPFCEELRLLKYYGDKAKRIHPSEWTNDYIKLRQEEIREVNLEKLDRYEEVCYFPKNRDAENTTINSIDIFLMRDRIGKIDSYRFYKDYFYFFDDLKNNIDRNGLNAEDNSKQIELILVIVLHEPNLLRTINDLLVDIKDYCQKLVEDIFFQINLAASSVTKLYYKWSAYSILRLAVIFFPYRFNEIKTWDTAFELSLTDNRALNYLSFLLWEGFLGESQLISNQIYINLISVYSDHLDQDISTKSKIYGDKRFRKIIKGITNKFAFSSVESLNDAYFNLRKFFFGQTSSNTHNEFIRYFSLFKNKIENIDKVKDDIVLIIGYIEQISNFLQDGILNNLLYIFNDTNIRKCHELNYNTLFNNTGVFEDLLTLIKQFDKIIESKTELIDKEDFSTITTSYYSLDKFYLKHIIEGSSFYIYCRGYKANLIKCLFDILSQESKIRQKLNGEKKLEICGVEIPFADGSWRKDLIKKIFKCENSEDVEIVYLSIHESFLLQGIEEILINSIKYTPSSLVKVQIEITVGKFETVIKFIHSEKGDLQIVPEMVKLIFESFCGSNNVKFYNDDKQCYNIEIKFNTKLLKLV